MGHVIDVSDHLWAKDELKSDLLTSLSNNSTSTFYILTLLPAKLLTNHLELTGDGHDPLSSKPSRPHQPFPRPLMTSPSDNTDLALARKRDDSDPGLVIRDSEVRQQLLDELDLIEEVFCADGGRGVDEEHQLHSLARRLTKEREGSYGKWG